MQLEKPVKVKTSRGELTIRSAELNDAKNLISLKKEYIKDCNTIPLYEEEYTNTVIDEELLIQHFISSKNSILLLAEIGGNLIGNIDLTGSVRKKMHHTGMIGMGILPDFRNAKIGSHLMEVVLNFAKVKLPLTVIWLEVYASNFAGIKLYEKFLFSVCGKIEGFFKEEGRTIDKIQMVKYL